MHVKTKLYDKHNCVLETHLVWPGSDSYTCIERFIRKK